MAELQIPKGIERANQAHSDRDYRMQKWLMEGTWLAFVAAAIYAGITYRQWRDLQRNFRAEQRAWVWQQPMESPLLDGWVYQQKIGFRNSGKLQRLRIRAGL